VQTPSLPPENLPENNYWLLVCVCKKEMSNGLAMVENWETKMSVCKGSGRGRSHATRPWMRFLAQWGLAPASLWDWGRPSFPLPLFFSCLWALSSTATLLSGNSSFFLSSFSNGCLFISSGFLLFFAPKILMNPTRGKWLLPFGRRIESYIFFILDLAILK